MIDEPVRPLPETEGDPVPRLRAVMGEAEFDRLLAASVSLRIFDRPLSELSREDLYAVLAYLGEQQARERRSMESLIETTQQLQLARAAASLRHTGNPQ